MKKNLMILLLIALIAFLAFSCEGTTPSDESNPGTEEGGDQDEGVLERGSGKLPFAATSEEPDTFKVLTGQYFQGKSTTDVLTITDDGKVDLSKMSLNYGNTFGYRMGTKETLQTSFTTQEIYDEILSVGNKYKFGMKYSGATVGEEISLNIKLTQYDSSDSSSLAHSSWGKGSITVTEESISDTIGGTLIIDSDSVSFIFKGDEQSPISYTSGQDFSLAIIAYGNCLVESFFILPINGD